MGEVIGAGIVAHVPTIVMSEAERRELNGGEDITLVDGLRRLRTEVFDVLQPDTIIVVDAHFFTTFEFVVTAHERRAGKFTSDELPRGMSQMPYDLTGDPELAEAIGAEGAALGTWMTPIDDPYLPIHYPTVNLLPYLQGCGAGGSERWVTVSCPQTGETDDFLLAGAAIGRAIARLDRRVVLLASGALSHRFWPLTQVRDHESSDPIHIFSDAHRAADYERIAWFEQGRHDLVIDTMPEFLRFSPEARFGHYLQMVAAIGGRECTAPGRLFGEYENATGTGQVHIWFDRPAGGWTA